MPLQNENRNMDLDGETSKTLPNGWVWTRLGEVLSFIKGKKPKDLGVKTEHRKIPYINIEAFEKRVFDQFTSNDDYPICEPDDILIVWDGARCGLVGRGVFGVIGSTLAKLVYSEINSSYLFYFIQSKYEYINKRPRGVGIPHVEPNLFWNIPLPLPPIAEQKRIVGKIEELFTRLDAGVEALKKIKAQIRRYRQAVLKYAFEGKLTEAWRRNNSLSVQSRENSGKLEKDEFLRSAQNDERKEAHNEKGVEAYNKSFPELPNGWRWVKLGEIAEVIMGQSPPSKTYNTVRIGLPFYQGKAEFGSIYPIPLKWCSKPKKIADKNDILLSVRAPVGSTNICFETSCIGRGLAAIRFGGAHKFLFYYLRSIEKEISHIGTGSTFSAISKSQISNLTIPLPPLAEQHQIVSEIERRFSVIEQIEKIVDQSLKQAERLRQSILKRAFEGKLVPQDPNDEPAEKLLERIRQQREQYDETKISKKKRKNFIK